MKNTNNSCLKCTEMLDVCGYRTTTVEVQLKAGTFTYKFSNNKYLGLPHDAYILGITAREGVAFNNTRTITGRPITRFTSDALLTIRSKQNQNDIINQVPLPVIYNDRLSPFNTIFLEPIKNKNINWISSFIEFPSEPALLDTDSIEFVIHYAMDKSYFPKLELVQNFYNNISFAGVRTSIVSVQTFAGQTRYNFSFNSKIELPQSAYIIGFQPLFEGVSPIGLPIVGTTVRNSSFITFKRGTNSIIDSIPYNYRVNPGLSLPYIPIEPLKVEEFDTQNSIIESSDVSVISDDQAYNILFYYVCDSRTESEQKQIKKQLNCYY